MTARRRSPTTPDNPVSDTDQSLGTHAGSDLRCGEG